MEAADAEDLLTVSLSKREIEADTAQVRGADRSGTKLGGFGDDAANVQRSEALTNSFLPAIMRLYCYRKRNNLQK